MGDPFGVVLLSVVWWGPVHRHGFDDGELTSLHHHHCRSVSSFVCQEFYPNKKLESVFVFVVIAKWK